MAAESASDAPVSGSQPAATVSRGSCFPRIGWGFLWRWRC
uniref:Uncharacterized protein n=1 Tax=Arundo donax TaxID=35708 RepID=A0A0A9DMZ6_ARUDO